MQTKNAFHEKNTFFEYVNLIDGKFLGNTPRPSATPLNRGE
jgi:hypothetical protein